MVDGLGWRTELRASVIRMAAGRSTDVITGIMATTGGLQIAMKTDDAWIAELSVALEDLDISLDQLEERLGHKLDSTIILPLGSASQLIVNLRQAISFKTRGGG